ncbi:MAG: coenzyme F420-0:L-glutamate ligase [Gammaproteobacteria bacterium]|nr:coenzyme F420-0:L-glutamate ligase [Gammaproteobacteria bacterium]
MPASASPGSIRPVSNTLALIPLTGLPLVEPGDDIAAMLLAAAARCAGGLLDGDLLVVAQKIVSKAENRYVDLDTVVPSSRARELAGPADKDPRLIEVILSESREVMRQRPGALIVEHRLGYVHANAGVDRSNVADPNKVLLLPLDPDASARQLRERARRDAGRNISVIINDSAGRAWRNGIIGFAIGCAGFRPVVNRIGAPDLFGRKLEITEIAVADELAAAASFVMGQADEAIPAVLVRGAKLEPSEEGMAALLRARERDLFRQ